MPDRKRLRGARDWLSLALDSARLAPMRRRARRACHTAITIFRGLGLPQSDADRAAGALFKGASYDAGRGRFE